MEEFHVSSATLAPLSERMRPQTLEEFLGQGHIVRKGSALFRAITAGTLGSCIFFGPPGTGKTTLAGIIANQMQGNFVKLNAVSCGVQEVKEVISQAKRDLQLLGKKTYLLLDECHRFNKAQSDSMLEAIEKGYITFIGSTTENPFTSMTRAIVSRCQIFEFRALTKTDILALLNRALTDSTRGFGALNIHISTQALEILANRSAGDARSALSSLELAVLSTPSAEDNSITITKEIVDECSKHNILATDTDIYYDMLSAFCKSLRGSDADAALYWSFRLIEAGVDPLIICRRLIAHASEDVGLANSQALVVATSALTAYQNLGKPEGLIPLAHAIIYVCMSPKSNRVIVALNQAQEDAKNSFSGAVPAHLKNTNYMNEKRAKYIYPHDLGGYAKQQYMPDEFKHRVYYVPSANGSEKSIVLPPEKQALLKHKEDANHD